MDVKLNKTDFHVPYEIIWRILTYVSGQEYRSWFCVNRLFSSISKSEKFWEEVICCHYSSHFLRKFIKFGKSKRITYSLIFKTLRKHRKRYIEKGIQIRVTGVGGVGKSSLTLQFLDGIFENKYICNVSRSHSKRVEFLPGYFTGVDVLDTAGQEEYSALRDTYLRCGDGFLLVYSTTEKYSLQELDEFYHQILMVKGVEYVPMVLVGNKIDLEKERECLTKEGKDFAKEWGGIPFIETSAKTGENVEKAFLMLVNEILGNVNEDDFVTELEQAFASSDKGKKKKKKLCKTM